MPCRNICVSAGFLGSQIGKNSENEHLPLTRGPFQPSFSGAMLVEVGSLWPIVIGSVLMAKIFLQQKRGTFFVSCLNGIFDNINWHYIFCPLVSVIIDLGLLGWFVWNCGITFTIYNSAMKKPWLFSYPRHVTMGIIS